MTEEKKKEISTDNKKSEKKVTKNKPASSNAGLLILLFIIVLTFSGTFYLLWESQQTDKILNQNSASKYRIETTELKEQLEETSEQYNEKFQSFEKAQENLRHNLTNLIRDNEHLRNDWLMAEAEYLIQLANHRLLLEKDVTTAIVALKAADARLAEVADPALLRIRKILSKDLNILKNIPVVDLAGLSITLNSLGDNIANLPLSTPDPKTHKLNQEEKEQTSSSVKSIKDLPAAIWKDIKGLIVIRNHEKPIQPLLAPEQHFFLLQNLSLLIEQSRLALLNGRNEIYQDRLKTSIKWIKKFFDTEHSVTINMLSSLKELQKFDINPALPDISATFSAIKKYRLQGNQPRRKKENKS